MVRDLLHLMILQTFQRTAVMHHWTFRKPRYTTAKILNAFIATSDFPGPDRNDSLVKTIKTLWRTNWKGTDV